MHFLLYNKNRYMLCCKTGDGKKEISEYCCVWCGTAAFLPSVPKQDCRMAGGGGDNYGATWGHIKRKPDTEIIDP